jgi:hypothetical protein
VSCGACWLPAHESISAAAPTPINVAFNAFIVLLVFNYYVIVNANLGVKLQL